MLRRLFVLQGPLGGAASSPGMNGTANGSATVAVRVDTAAAAAGDGTSAVAKFEAVHEVVVQFKRISCWVREQAGRQGRWAAPRPGGWLRCSPAVGDRGRRNPGGIPRCWPLTPRAPWPVPHQVPKLLSNPPTFSKAGAARLVGLGPKKDARQPKEEMRQVGAAAAASWRACPSAFRRGWTATRNEQAGGQPGMGRAARLCTCVQRAAQPPLASWHRCCTASMDRVTREKCWP